MENQTRSYVYSDIYKQEPRKFAEKGFKKTVDVYEDIVNPKTGKLETKLTKNENFYTKIQEMKEYQELENIIKRYNIDLNDNHITEINQELVDMTNIPTDLVEVYAMTTKLETMFNESSAPIKAHFKDFAGFLQSFKQGTLTRELSKLHSEPTKIYKEPEQTVVEPTIEPVNPTGGTIYGQ